MQGIDELSHSFPDWDDEALIAALLNLMRPTIRNSCPIELLKGLVLMKTVTVRRLTNNARRKTKEQTVQTEEPIESLETPRETLRWELVERVVLVEHVIEKQPVYIVHDLGQ